MMVHTLEGIWAYIRPKVLALVSSSGGGVTIRKNSGADVGTRPRLNLIEGTNVTMTIADDAGGNEVDITINASGGGGSSMTTVEKDLGSTPKTFGKFTVADGSVVPASKIFIQQAPGPYTGKGTRADEAEMDSFKLTVTEVGTGTFTVAWSSASLAVPVLKERTSANNNAVLAAQNATFSRDTAPFIIGMRMLGKVRGNVKFDYMVLS